VARGKKCHDLNEFLQRASGHLELPDTVIRLNRLHEDVIEEEAKSAATPGSGVWRTGAGGATKDSETQVRKS
jgi:hypothetical protein